MARRAARVVVNNRNPESGRAAIAEIAAAGGHAECEAVADTARDAAFFAGSESDAARRRASTAR